MDYKELISYVDLGAKLVLGPIVVWAGWTFRTQLGIAVEARAKITENHFATALDQHEEKDEKRFEKLDTELHSIDARRQQQHMDNRDMMGGMRTENREQLAAIKAALDSLNRWREQWQQSRWGGGGQGSGG
jgi:hypothetical protein